MTTYLHFSLFTSIYTYSILHIYIYIYIYCIKIYNCKVKLPLLSHWNKLPMIPERLWNRKQRSSSTSICVSVSLLQSHQKYLNFGTQYQYSVSVLSISLNEYCIFFFLVLSFSVFTVKTLTSHGVPEKERVTEVPAPCVFSVCVRDCLDWDWVTEWDCVILRCVSAVSTVDAWTHPRCRRTRSRAALAKEEESVKEESCWRHAHQVAAVLFTVNSGFKVAVVVGLGLC